MSVTTQAQGDHHDPVAHRIADAIRAERDRDQRERLFDALEARVDELIERLPPRPAL